MMACHPTAFSSVPTGTAPSQYAARRQRTNQVQYIEERLRNGIPPSAVADITALLAQLETQPTLLFMAVSILADVSGYKRTMTCRNGVWDDHDLMHPFLDGRSTMVYGPSTHTTFEQGATLRMSSGAPITQSLPPAHLVIQPPVQALPQPTPQSQQPTYLTECATISAHAHVSGTRHPSTPAPQHRMPVLPPYRHHTWLIEHQVSKL